MPRQQLENIFKMQSRSQDGGRGPGLPLAQLKQDQFALNRKHAFFNAMS